MATSLLPSPRVEKDTNNEKLPENLQKILKSLVDKYEKEDSWARRQMVKTWKKNDAFWHGVQFVFWSESRQDWVSPVESRWFLTEEGREDTSDPFYDFVINIYKAHGEAIIAALSAQMPAVRFPPDDADDEEDLMTSKTYAKIADLIQRHNQAKMLLLSALFILWNQGPVYAYHASKADKNFGTLKTPNFKKGLTCESCEQGKPVDNPEELIEGMPCPTCNSPMKVTEVLDSFSESPKSRVLIDIFGGLHVKVPYYARTQKDWGYVILSLDQPKAFLKNLYPHVSDEIEKDYSEIGQYERVARTPSSFSAFATIDENRDLATLKRCWLRTWVLDSLGESQEFEKKKLKKLFPNGIYVAFVGNTYVESRDEDLDKHWTGGQSGLSQYWHSDALGQPLISPQGLRNALVNITMETIEHGIPSSFANTKVLNFKTFSKHEARPGMVYPVTPVPGERVADAFYEGARATLSKEIPLFWAQVDKDAQFTTGSFPSIYGGPGEGKSRTFSEYNMSRQMSLQRLSIAWAFVVNWWSRLMEKCVHLFAENLVEDEKFTKFENNNYQTVWIRRAEMTGHVGEVEPEGAETFPMSTTQKQALLMHLLELKDQFISAAVFDPENRKLLADALSFPEFEIPGEDQRIKQAREIQQMLRGEPAVVEAEVDDHAIHISGLKHFMVGPLGLDVKRTNPQGYALLSDHLKAHIQILTIQTQAAFGGTNPGQPPGGAPDA